MPKPNLVPLSEIETPSDLPKFEVEIIDRNQPRSIINLVPQKVRDAIDNIRENFPHYLTELEMDLHAIVKPSDMDDDVRVAFWKEYTRAQDRGIHMQMKNVYGPFCTHTYFYTYILKSPQRVAWIINQPSNYLMALEASLHYGKNFLGKIMREGPFNKDGSLDVKKASIFLKAYELLDNRVRGSVIQKIESKTVNAHLHAKVKTPEDELDQQIEALRDAEQV